MEKEEKIVFVREQTLGSIISDIFSFGMILVSFWFNQQYIGGNDWLDALLFFSFFFFSMGRVRELKLLNDRASKALRQSDK